MWNEGRNNILRNKYNHKKNTIFKVENYDSKWQLIFNLADQQDETHN